MRRIGGLGTCACCFDDEVLPEDELRCCADVGHAFCIPCVKRAALEHFGRRLFTLNLAQLATSNTSCSSGMGKEGPDLSCSNVRCMHTSGCEGLFSESSLLQALPAKEYKRYTRRSAALQATSAGLENLVPCPACDFMVEMSDASEATVICLDPECGKRTCRWCREPDHAPLRCDEVEKDAETRLRTYLEERMAESSMRRCPNKQCGKAFERTEGCNKMACPCGTSFCYLCGQRLDKKRPYDHYKDGHVGGGKDSGQSKCTVYGTPAWAKKSAAEHKEDARRSLADYLQDNPELRDIVRQSSGAKRKRFDELLGKTGSSSIHNEWSGVHKRCAAWPCAVQ